MDNASEDFFLEMSIDGGLNYEIVEEWNLGDEFINDIRYNEELLINGPFSPLTKFRFRCDASGYADWVYIDDVSVVAECPTAISLQENSEVVELRSDNNHEESFTFRTYPNPVFPGMDINIELENLSDINHILLYDQNGSIVKRIERSSIFHKTTINTANLNSGIYFLNVLAGENTSVKKIIVL